jgi:hypothetical protein
MVRAAHVVLFCVITTQNKRGEEMREFSALLSAARAFPSLTFSSPRERKISSPLPGGFYRENPSVVSRPPE